jgi:L-asparaginase II
MANPVVVEVIRGSVVESRHRGAVAVVDGDGVSLFSIGDTGRPVFPRSAIKALQAIPLVESGAADTFGFGDRHLALACASHSGEEPHVSLAMEMLRSAGFDENVLECGSHWPLGQQAMVDLAARGEAPAPRHNNCSGKHAGFLCTCRHLGMDPEGYSDRDHPVQQLIREVLEQMTGAPHSVERCGRDGCSIPTYAVPLNALARGFSRAVTGSGLSPSRAEAATRLLSACMNEPYYVAGNDRACTRMMQAARGRIFAKVGAEGVFAGAVPERGLGFALKIDDGAERAAEVVAASVLAQMFERDDPASASLRDMARRRLENRRGIVVGEVRPARALVEVSGDGGG